MNTQASNPANPESQEGQPGPHAAGQDKQLQAHQPAGSPSDYLANERTLLAWIRTGVALIALGFVVARFGLLLRELGLRSTQPAQDVLGGHGSSIIGTVIILLAALLLGMSYLRYRGAARALDQGSYHYSRLLSVVVIAAVILIALLLAAYLLLTS